VEFRKKDKGKLCGLRLPTPPARREQKKGEMRTKGFEGDNRCPDDERPRGGFTGLEGEAAAAKSKSYNPKKLGSMLKSRKATVKNPESP